MKLLPLPFTATTEGMFFSSPDDVQKQRKNGEKIDIKKGKGAWPASMHLSK